MAALRTGDTFRVLIVDDDPGLRDVLEMVLQDEGYVTALAADGEEALAKLEEAPVDVILLDFSMPRCNGEEFARRYRQGGGAEERAPIILLTATHDLSERCQRVAADGCVGKPFEIDDLLETLARQRHHHAA